MSKGSVKNYQFDTQILRDECHFRDSISKNHIWPYKETGSGHCSKHVLVFILLYHDETGLYLMYQRPNILNRMQDYLHLAYLNHDRNIYNPTPGLP